MTRPPRLGSSCRQLQAARQVVRILKNVLDLDLLCNPVSDGLAELFQILPLDDKDRLIEARADGVIDRKINDEVSRVGHGIQLLQPAIARTKPCGKNYQSHEFISLCEFLQDKYTRKKQKSKEVSENSPEKIPFFKVRVTVFLFFSRLFGKSFEKGLDKSPRCRYNCII